MNGDQMDTALGAGEERASATGMPVDFGAAAREASGAAARQADVIPLAQTPGFLLDVRLTVTAEVGRVPMSVRSVMDLGVGSLIELQRSAAEPIEILVNGRTIGRGEIVVIGDQFGVRVTELGPTGVVQ